MVVRIGQAHTYQDELNSAPFLKKCGNCTGCCGPSSLHVPGVFGAWERCPHARAKRCAIYTDRPNECRDYQCTWTLAPSWPAELRPDRCGFIAIYQEREAQGHLDVVFCGVPPGVNRRLLGQAIVLLLVGGREAGANRITLLYGDKTREPKVEIDEPFSAFAGRPDEDVALEILELWGLELSPAEAAQGLLPKLEP